MRDYEQTIRKLVSAGNETTKVDFKEKLDLSRVSAVADLAKTVLAIANTDSNDLEGYGYVILGAKRHALVGGMDEFAKDSECAALVQKILNYIEPIPDIEVKTFKDQNVGLVAAIVIAPSPPERRPHFVKKECTDDRRTVFRRNECYVRAGEVVTLATPHDYQRMYRAQLSPPRAPQPVLHWRIGGVPSDMLRIPPKGQMVRSDEVAPSDFATEQLAAASPEWRKRLERYNTDLEAYRKKFEDYLDWEMIHRFLAESASYVSLVLENVGEAPLEQVRVELTLPEGFIVDHEENIPEQLERPVPPHRPRSPQSLAEALVEGTGLAELFFGGAGPSALSPMFPSDFNPARGIWGERARSEQGKEEDRGGGEATGPWDRSSRVRRPCRDRGTCRAWGA